jgi:hypothetical protein
MLLEPASDAVFGKLLWAMVDGRMFLPREFTSIAVLLFRLAGCLGIRLAYCLSDLQVLRVRTHLLTGPKLRFSILRCAIQAASGKTAVAGYPPVLRATDMPTHSVLSHIKGQNAPDSDFESEDAPPNSPPQNCSLQTIPPIVAF